MVDVKKATTAKELRNFSVFKQTLYEGNEYFVPEVISDDLEMFDKKKNPAYAYCEAECFLAYKDGKIAGRIAAIINRASNEKWGQNRIRFSHFDFIDDREVSAALMDEVAKMAKNRGLDEIHGPLGFCDLDKEGMLIEGFDEINTFITLYNHPYYADHMEALGFEKDADWIEYQIKVPEEINEKVDRINKFVLKRNDLRVVRPKNRKEIRLYVERIFDLLNDEYSGLYGTVPITKEQVTWYYKKFIGFLNPDFLCFVVDSEETLVGFAIAVPSLSKAVKKSRGRLLPFGIFRMLRALKKSDVLEMFLIAVREKYQGTGVNAVLMTELSRTTIAYGMKYAETGPELETNHKVMAMWKNYEARHHKTRRCYRKKLD